MNRLETHRAHTTPPELPICTVLGCYRPIVAGQLCSPHYNQTLVGTWRARRRREALARRRIERAVEDLEVIAGTDHCANVAKRVGYPDWETLKKALCWVGRLDLIARIAP